MLQNPTAKVLDYRAIAKRKRLTSDEEADVTTPTKSGSGEVQANRLERVVDSHLNQPFG